MPDTGNMQFTTETDFINHLEKIKIEIKKTYNNSNLVFSDIIIEIPKITSLFCIDKILTGNLRNVSVMNDNELIGNIECFISHDLSLYRIFFNPFINIPTFTSMSQNVDKY